MAKMSAVNKNKKRIKLSNKFYKKRFNCWIKSYFKKKQNV